MEKATFAGGCFWCTEAIFQKLRGVTSVVSGYAGGIKGAPTYHTVSSGKSGYVEAVQITFDPQIIAYDTLLAVFWATHDPTTKDRQGADVGTQYRSIIFYHTEKQKEKAFASKENLENKKMYHDPIVTEILPFNNFYDAESYHQNFYKNNKTSPYCQLVIDPKIKKLLKEFSHNIKTE